MDGDFHLASHRILLRGDKMENTIVYDAVQGVSAQVEYNGGA